MPTRHDTTCGQTCGNATCTDTYVYSHTCSMCKDEEHIPCSQGSAACATSAPTGRPECGGFVRSMPVATAHPRLGSKGSCQSSCLGTFKSVEAPQYLPLACSEFFNKALCRYVGGNKPDVVRRKVLAVGNNKRLRRISPCMFAHMPETQMSRSIQSWPV